MNSLINKLVEDMKEEFANSNIEATVSLEVEKTNDDIEYKVHVRTKDKYSGVSILDSLLSDEYYTTKILPCIPIDMVSGFKI